MEKKKLLFVFPMVAGTLTGCMDIFNFKKDEHNLTFVPSVAATCTEDGVLAHYHCDHCDKDFADQYAKEELTTTIDPKIGHDLSEHAAKEATCTEDGQKKYWTCSHEDGVYYKDAQGNERYNSWEEIIVGKKAHVYTSLEISGNYEKNYQAFEEFDTSNLVVKTKCENCENTITLEENEYVISYNSFGADSLRAGDTKVTVYAPDLELTKEITGLTVSKVSVPKPTAQVSSFAYDGTEKTFALTEDIAKYSISNNKATKAGEYYATVTLLDKDNYEWEDSDGSTDDLTIPFSITKANNEFSGLEASYATTCGVEPDLTNVTATSGDITVKYFFDEGCEEEVGAEDLVAGAFFMKVSAGSENYTEISEVVPLTVNHDINHHEAVAAKILEEGSIEYWGCDGCGLAYADEQQTQQLDSVVVPASGVAISECAMDSNDIVFEADTQEEAPKGFEKVNRISLSSEDDIATDFHEKRWDTKYFSQAVVDEYKAVAFAIKSEDTTLYVDGYGHQVEDNSWVVVEITPSGDYNYNVLFRTEDGEEITTLSFKWGPESHPGAGYVDGAINSIMFKADCYPVEPTDNFLVTELKAVYKTEPVGELIENCAINSNGATPVEKLMPAPTGFRHVSAVEVAGARGDTLYYSTINVSQFNYLTFAIKTKSQYLLADGWAAYQSANVWVTVKIENLGNHNYRVTFTNLSVPSETYVEEFEWAEATFGVADALNAIMFKANTYADGADTMYVTELRGKELEVVPTGEVIDTCVMSANGVSMSDSEVEAPKGYTSVKEGSFTDSVHGQFFSAQDLTAYEEVHFALKTDATYNFNNKNTYDGHGWMFFTLTNNGDGTFNIVVFDESGTKIHEDTNLAGFKGENPGVYTNYALNAILYGNVDGYTPYASGALTLYATELRGTKTPVVPTGTIIDESAYSANGCTHTLTTDVDAPEGYEKVSAIGVGNDSGSFMHGQAFSASVITGYSEVHFALRTSGFILFEGWNKLMDKQDKWAFFSLTNNGDTTFDLVVTDEDGNTLYEASNLPSFKGAEPGVYTNYGLNALLYGNSLEIKPCKRDQADFTLYATELRGTKIPVSPTGIIVDSCAVSANGVSMATAEIELPDGFENVKVGEFTNSMHGQFYSAKDLRKYSEVHFAMKTTAWISFDDWSDGYSGDDWIVFSLTNNGDTTFNLTISKLSGEVLCTKENLASFKGENPGVYANYALSAILYGNPGVGYIPLDDGKTFNVYVTELIETLEAQNPTGSIIDECAISANGVSTSETSLEAPNGFEKVSKWEGSSRHGMFYSAEPLTDYDDIHFAMKTDGSFNFNNEKSHSDINWLFFNLKNNKDTTFNLTVSDVFGNLVYSMNSMASYKGVDPGNYTNYALNAILYGIPAGIAPSGTNVYVTELRGTLCNELNIVSNSTTEYNIVYQPNNRYIINNDNQANQTAVKLLETNLKSAGSLSSISKVASSNEVFSDSIKSISIGDTSLLRTSGALNGETLNGGYLIKTVGNSVFVYAENPSDYIIAVNDLMEMMFGYKFYASTEIVLNHSSDIKMSRVDKVVNPSFKERNAILANGSMLATDDRSQLGYDSGYEWTISTQTHGMCGNFLNISANESSHPNWYSRGNDKWGQAQYQLCYSAHGNTSEYEAMVSQTSSEIIQKVLNDYSYELTASNFPEIIIDLSIQDNWYECNCASCQAEKAKYGSFAGQQLHFVNDVANATDSWFTSQMPNVKHSYKMLAYQQGQKAPTNIDFSLNENIEIEFAPVYVDVTNPIASTGSNAEHYNDICSWINLLESKGLSANNMSLWLYSYSVNNIIPVYDYDAFQQTYKNMKDLGITKIRNQFQDGPQLTSFQDLNFYLKGLAMQDVNADLEEAAKDFINQYYGSGSSKIYAYYTAMINNMKSTYTDDNTVFNAHNDKKYWSKSVVQNLISLCDDAINAVNDSSEDSARKEVLINRINRERLTAVYMMLEFKYTTIFNKTTYKNFFSSTCSELGITHITATQTVSSWLSSK